MKYIVPLTLRIAGGLSLFAAHLLAQTNTAPAKCRIESIPPGALLVRCVKSPPDLIELGETPIAVNVPLNREETLALLMPGYEMEYLGEATHGVFTVYMFPIAVDDAIAKELPNYPGDAPVNALKVLQKAEELLASKPEQRRKAFTELKYARDEWVLSNKAAKNPCWILPWYASVV
ncbi:MAG: hypothetical protein HY360_12115 [Verrucomicrobia bacterium]|nr:hypothetical protein [Verrucomicrobiota bacterium]